MILYLANLHAKVSDQKKPRSFCQVQLPLTSLRNWVHDYKVVFDHFFEIQRLGYSYGDDYEISTVIPKKLAVPVQTPTLGYVVPKLPETGVVSKVYVKKENREHILQKLASTERLDLHAPVTWLLDLPSTEVNFYFQPAGKLKLRDTSTWPIPGIETWPAWLRSSLFGDGIDIETAYTQYLVTALRKIYHDRPSMFELGYPDLIRLIEDKTDWRKEICCEYLGLEFTDENISVVKKLTMSLANGSNISPAILTSGVGYSVTSDIIFAEAKDVSLGNLNRIGTRLSAVAKQFASARKVVCSAEHQKSSSRVNQKLVFKSYFEWERAARYKIWEAVGQHGLMVHDGIDGIPDVYLDRLPDIIRELDIKLSR